MNVIILSGGIGTRIQSISKGIPKALLPVGSRVFLDYIIEWLSKCEVERIILSLYHKPQMFLSYLENGKLPLEAIPIVEPNPMGTGGAVKYVLDNIEISEPFGVINGDTLFDFNLQDMIKTFKNINCSAMISLSHVKNADRYGIVLYEDNKAIAFNEKTSEKSGWINNGCYIFKKDVFDTFEGRFSIEKDFFSELVKQKKLFVYPTHGEFWDIGIPADYYNFVKNILTKK